MTDLGPDMIEVHGEIALPLSPLCDASLPLRLAATAAAVDVPSPRHRSTAWPIHAASGRSWSEETRAAFVELLGLGRPAIDKIESLDQHGLLVRLIPEWAAVRNKPQRNAYHTYTVDRHLLEAVARGGPDRHRRTSGPPPGRDPPARHRKGVPGRPHHGRHRVGRSHRHKDGFRQGRRRRPGRPRALPPLVARHRNPARPRRPHDHCEGRAGRRQPAHAPFVGCADGG